MTNKWVKWIFIMMAISVIFTGCGNETEPTPETPAAPIVPTFEQRKSGAAAVGEWVITRNDDGYNGRVGVFVGLDMVIVMVRPDAHYRVGETLNLCIRERHAGNDDWTTVQTLTVGAGDYIIINTDTTGVNSVSVR